MAFEFNDIQKLAELLKGPEEDSDDDDDLPKCGVYRMGPGDIDNQRVVSGKSEEDDNDIWNEAEVAERVVHSTEDDPRERPEYDITYMQQVTAEDVYLQMGGKTPSTASCEYMVVTVKLPGEAPSDVSLVTTDHHLDVRSPRYYLSLDLPHPVNTSTSRAEWVCEKSALRIVLRMEREFDFVNF